MFTSSAFDQEQQCLVFITNMILILKIIKIETEYKLFLSCETLEKFVF